MPYYLAPYIGAGTFLDPFRPRGSGQPGWSAIDLRPDSSRLDGGGLNAALLHLPVADPDPLLRLIGLAPTDPLGAVVVAGINMRLGTSVVPGTLRDIVAQLLLAPPVNGWKVLLPTIQRRYEIHLGGLLYQQPVIAGGVSISENWTCSDSASLTCQLTWTEVFSTGWNLTTNAAQADGPGGAHIESARAESDLATADQDVSVDAIRLVNTVSNSVGGVAARFAAAAETLYSGFIWREFAAGRDRVTLRKTVTGTETDLAHSADQTITPPDRIRLTVSGSSLEAFLNGTSVVTATDTAITGNTRCGIVAYKSSYDAADSARLDDWSAADLAAGGAALDAGDWKPGAPLPEPVVSVFS